MRILSLTLIAVIFSFSGCSDDSNNVHNNSKVDLAGQWDAYRIPDGVCKNSYLLGLSCK